jgi:hypothetical protein
MGNLAEILQAIIALVLIAGDLTLRIMKIPTDGFDSAVTVIVAVYVGGKVSMVSANNASKTTLQGVNCTPTTNVPSATQTPLA